MNLSLKLALYIAILAIIGAAAVGTYSYSNIRERVSADALDSVEALIKTVYNTAATSAYVGDSELAREVILGLANNSEILCVSIEAKALQVADETCEGDQKILRDLYSPWDETEKVGELNIFINQKYLDTISAAQIYRELLNIIQIVVLISFAIAAATYFLITKPIERVSRKLSNINFDGDVDIIWEAEREDEIGQISKVINSLLIQAKKQILVEKQLSLKTHQLTNNFKLIFEMSTNSLAVTDDQLRLTSYNPQFEKLVAMTNNIDQLKNTANWIDCISDDSTALFDLISQATEINTPVSCETQVSQNDDKQIPHRFFNLTFTKTEDFHNEISILIFISDITDQRRKLLQSEYEASHDNLTKLLNRRAATKKIRCTLDNRKNNSKSFAMLVIDLDGFKEVNDTLGHDAGDLVLREIASRLTRTRRKTDIVCRWGGDEFLIGLEDADLAAATKAANTILTAIRRPIDINGQLRFLGASIGLAITQGDGDDFAQLFDRADKAMYIAKKSGKCSVLAYSSD